MYDLWEQIYDADLGCFDEKLPVRTLIWTVLHKFLNAKFKEIKDNKHRSKII